MNIFAFFCFAWFMLLVGIMIGGFMEEKGDSNK
jgi:hypothetical protein